MADASAPAPVVRVAAGVRTLLLFDAEIELRVPTPPHHVHANIPPALSDVVMRLLAKDPRQRHATADALKRDLAHLDDGSAAWEALLPTPEGWEEAAPPAEPGPLRAGRASRRRWWGLGLAACVGAGALAASMRALWKQEASPRPPSQEASLTPARAPTSFPAPGLTPTPEPPPMPKLPPPSPGFVVPPAASEKDRPMKKSPAPPQVTAKRSSPASQLCLGASLALSVNAGCASVQTIPPKGDCPPAAVATMKGRGWRPIQGYDFIIDVHHTRSEGDGTFIPSGDVVGRIVQIEGTLFHGKLWWGDPTERIGHVRYTEAELPDGSKVPVCFAGILPWQPGSTPERPLFQGESAGTFKFRWDNDFP